VPALKYDEISSRRQTAASTGIADRVEAARRLQTERFAGTTAGNRVYCNAQMGPQQIRRFCPVSAPCDEILRAAIDRLGLSARAYHRVLKVARTIADLEGAESIRPAHITEAVQYRTLDRNTW